MAKSKNKVWFDISSFTELAERFNDLYKNRHTVTGETRKSLYREPVITKEGHDFYSVNVGFDIAEGGLASIFLMYGTPRMKPDRKFRSDLYGRKTKQENFEMQNKIFQKYVQQLGD